MAVGESWGRYPQTEQDIYWVDWLSDPLWSVEDSRSVLPYGQGRSYGDSCLNDGGSLLVTQRLNRLISFDTERGIVRAEAGITLAELLKVVVPKGWFPMVLPGTKFVSLGGAIANDIHGKNHHRSGTFGAHVVQLELARSSGERMVCSPAVNSDLFAATLGGLGLTGMITRVDLQLRKVQGPLIDVETIKFDSLDEFLEISSDSDEGYEYTVAWLDCVNQVNESVRGHFMRGNHSSKPQEVDTRRVGQARALVPFDFPGFTLNPLSVAAFNWAYYSRQRAKSHRAAVLYDGFFFPLDSVLHWNRIYGRRGFFQFQCVVPSADDNRAIREVLKSVLASGKGSFLAVLKEFGSILSPGTLSFPTEGVTLCLDFPNQGERTVQMMRELEDLVRLHGGRMYPAKDALMSVDAFNEFYPQWRDFKRYVDPKFSSSFWRRVTGGSG